MAGKMSDSKQDTCRITFCVLCFWAVGGLLGTIWFNVGGYDPAPTVSFEEFKQIASTGDIILVDYKRGWSDHSVFLHKTRTGHVGMVLSGKFLAGHPEVVDMFKEMRKYHFGDEYDGDKFPFNFQEDDMYLLHMGINTVRLSSLKKRLTRNIAAYHFRHIDDASEVFNEDNFLEFVFKSKDFKENHDTLDQLRIFSSASGNYQGKPEYKGKVYFCSNFLQDALVAAKVLPDNMDVMSVRSFESIQRIHPPESEN
eukprot:370902_1